MTAKSQVYHSVQHSEGLLKKADFHIRCNAGWTEALVIVAANVSLTLTLLACGHRQNYIIYEHTYTNKCCCVHTDYVPFLQRVSIALAMQSAVLAMIDSV